MKSQAKNIFVGILVISVVAVFALMLSSCNYREIRDANDMITDFNGRNVQYPSDVERIATVGSAARSVVYAGAQDKLVAITEMDRPTELRPYTLVDPELFSSLPTTSDGNHLNSTNIDKEKLLELNPDVILSSRSKSECERLQKDLNIPVIGVGFQDEILLVEFWQSLKIVGEVCGTEVTANRRIGYIKTISDEAQKC
ncbi:MAG: ABC transporter substrate-binding protein [Coriobacteriia bacterium]|nr:ABC transporter substrate-binding protein [Coriobacteriia bacterium]